MNEATTVGSTGAQALPEGVCLVASRFFFEYDEKRGEFRKVIHEYNPRYDELRRIVNDPQAGVPDSPSGNPHGRILEAYDAYDADFRPLGHSVVTVCGGYNGGGSDYKWCEYLEEIAGAVRRLTDMFGFAWLVGLQSHSDVWYADIGFTDIRRDDGKDSDKDRPRYFSDDVRAYDRHREKAIGGRLPFGIVCWGRLSYGKAWAKLRGPYAFPQTAFHGSLIQPTNVANQYAVFSADTHSFMPAYGVYRAHNSLRAFYALAAESPVLDTLTNANIRAIGDMPRGAFRLLEDWTPSESAK